MRVTVCETPHDSALVAASWKALCDHTHQQGTDILVLPEFAFLPPVWEGEIFNASRWRTVVGAAKQWIERLPELQCDHVIGAYPVTDGDKRYNQGFRWSAADGYTPLRRKHFLPDEPGGRETRWFARGEADFPAFRVGNQTDSMSFGLNICTELWALETYGHYASMGVQAIVTPRATGAATIDKWVAAGKVAAVRSGAYSLSSNRVHADGACSGVGWIIDPDGKVIATTSASEPFVTRELSMAFCDASKRTYPRYVFA